jgi:hypothetical protein
MVQGGEVLGDGSDQIPRPTDAVHLWLTGYPLRLYLALLLGDRAA